MELRIFEIIPGALSWSVIILFIVFSFLKPEIVAIYTILFSFYWLLKSLYFLIHVSHGFLKMKKYIKINWLQKIERLKWQHIYHLVIIPSYNEQYEVLKKTLDGIRFSEYPKDKIIVVLGAEEKSYNLHTPMYEQIEKEYANDFFKFLITIHPRGLAGEMPGKGSNASYAAQEVQKKIIDPLKIPYENIIVSNLDADTVIYPQYLACLTYHFLTTKDPLHHSYQPIPLFNNNIYDAHVFSRLLSFTTSFWQMIQQSQNTNIVTFSTHSIPWKTLVEIGFWQKDIVSEDSRIFWQCLIHFNGNWGTVPLYYPVSMDANIHTNLWETIKNLYRQQRRWAWGVENVAFILSNFIKNKNIPLLKKIHWTINQISGFYSWAVNSLILFILGWLPLLINGNHFNQMVLYYNLPNLTQQFLFFANVGIVGSAFIAISILPPKPSGIRWYYKIWYIAQWILLPITFIFLGSIPALDAQTRLMLGGKFRLGFWVTPKGNS